MTKINLTKSLKKKKNQHQFTSMWCTLSNSKWTGLYDLKKKKKPLFFLVRDAHFGLYLRKYSEDLRTVPTTTLIGVTFFFQYFVIFFAYFALIMTIIQRVFNTYECTNFGSYLVDCPTRLFRWKFYSPAVAMVEYRLFLKLINVHARSLRR